MSWSYISEVVTFEITLYTALINIFNGKTKNFFSFSTLISIPL